MFHFSNISNSNENNTDNIIDSQSKEFIKKQNTLTKLNNDVIQEGFEYLNDDSKKKFSFNDPSKLYNSTYSEPLQKYVTDSIDFSKKEYDKISGLSKESPITNANANFMKDYNKYSQYNQTILSNTQQYIDTIEPNDVINGKNINVFVDRLSDDANFVGLYNIPTNLTPSNSAMDLESCKKLANIQGYSNFSLLNTDASYNSQCIISKDLSQLTSPGLYVPNCKQGSDGYMYGGGWGNALYEYVINGTPKFLGCYKDTPNRAMTTNGYGNNNNAVYTIGKFGCSPWGSGNGTFPNKNAQWIWYTQNAGQNAPVNSQNPVTIRGEINITSSNIVYAEIYGMCDNYCTIAVNGNNYNANLNSNANTTSRNLLSSSETMVISGGWGGGGKTGYIVALNPGINFIDAGVENMGGPAGIILCIILEGVTPTMGQNNNLNILSSTNGTVSYCTDNINWKCIPVGNTALPFSQSFSVATCGNYAYNNGYKYFALQNIINNNTNSAQCFVSNNLSQATQYGQWNGSVSLNGNTLGVGGGSAVYSFNSSDNSDNINNIGKMGYINEDNQMIQYPSSMIQMGTSKSYTLFDNLDSPGNNISITNANLSKKQCEQQCNTNANCYGYVYSPNSSTPCSLKNNNVFSSINLSGPIISSKDTELNVKNAQVINNNGCPKIIKPISSVDWNKYTLQSTPMSMDTTCGLETLNKQTLDERSKYLSTTLEPLTKTVANGIASLMQTNKDMTDNMKTEHDLIKNNLTLYDIIYDKYNKVMNSDNNVNNILENSQITVLQSRYYYILWAILAIAIVIALIFLIRKYTQ